MRPKPANGPALGRLMKSLISVVGDALHRVPVLRAVGRIEHEVAGARVDAVDQAEALGRWRRCRRSSRRWSRPAPPTRRAPWSPRSSSRRSRSRSPSSSAAAAVVLGASSPRSPAPVVAGVVVVVAAARGEREGGGDGEGGRVGASSFVCIGGCSLSWCECGGGCQVDRTPASGASATSAISTVLAGVALDVGQPRRVRDDLHEAGPQLAQPGDGAAGQQEDQGEQAEAEEDAGDGVAALAVLQPVEQRPGDLLEARRHAGLVERPLADEVRDEHVDERAGDGAGDRAGAAGDEADDEEDGQGQAELHVGGERPVDHQHRPGETAVRRR